MSCTLARKLDKKRLVILYCPYLNYISICFEIIILYILQDFSNKKVNHNQCDFGTGILNPPDVMMGILLTYFTNLSCVSPYDSDYEKFLFAAQRRSNLYVALIGCERFVVGICRWICDDDDLMGDLKFLSRASRL